MPLQSIKVTLASAWVLLVVVVGLVVGVASTVGMVALATLGLLPALGLLLLWHDPTPSLSESITKALR
jgi:hypothetical protein